METMELDDFQLEPIKKSVAKIKVEDLDKKSGVTATDSSGKVQTYTDDENVVHEKIHTYSKIEDTIVAQLDKQVDSILGELLQTPTNSKEMKDLTSALNNMGDKEVSATSSMSNRMLQNPLRSMRTKGGESDSIATELKKLRMKITDLDPSKRTGLFGTGWKLPFGLGRRVDSYFQEYRTSEQQLNDIVKALYNGKDSLIEDNAAIDVERENMQKLMGRLEQYAYIMKKLDKRIEDKLPEVESQDQLKASDIKQEVLFPVRQKRMDLLQHMAVCMQGYMALGVIKKNNVELIRGVDRATKTTMAALRTAVMVSEALGTQKLVLDQVNAVNDATNSLIESNAAMLKQQGVEIQKQATQAAVSAEVLKKSFKDIFSAMDAIDKYREESLPKMQSTINDLDQTLSEAKTYLQSRERNAVQFSKELSKESKEDSKVVSVRP